MTKQCRKTFPPGVAAPIDFMSKKIGKKLDETPPTAKVTRDKELDAILKSAGKVNPVDATRLKKNLESTLDDLEWMIEKYKNKELTGPEILNLSESMAKNIRKDLLELSPMSKERADELAAKIEYTPRVKNYFKRLKLGDPQEVTSEFIRMTNTNITKSLNTIDVEEIGRAYASEKEKKIVMGSEGPAYYAKPTFYHELSHHLEFSNRAFLKRNLEYIQEKAYFDSPQPLKKIAPGKGYSSTEMAYRGDFSEPYVSKDYGPFATELQSMTIEKIAAGQSLFSSYHVLTPEKRKAYREELFFVIDGLIVNFENGEQ